MPPGFRMPDPQLRQGPPPDQQPGLLGAPPANVQPLMRPKQSAAVDMPPTATTFIPTPQMMVSAILLLVRCVFRTIVSFKKQFESIFVSCLNILLNFTAFI